MCRALPLLLALSMTWTSRASAEDAATKDDSAGALAQTSGWSRAKGNAAALLPGLLLHGSGHWAIGEKKTAYRLMQWQAIGVGAMVTSAGVLGLTGASPRGIELSIPGLITGSGIVLNTFLADLYGVNSLGRERRDAAELPETAIELSYAYVNEPQFAYGNLAFARARVAWGELAVEPMAWVAMDDDNQRARLPLSYRVWHSEAGESFDVNVAATHHRFGSDAFSTWTEEASVSMRLAMSRFGDSLRGSFVTGNLGFGLISSVYKNDDIDSDHSSLLIAGFGYGFLLPRGGETEFYYQHRRDSFVGGLSPSSRNGSGFIGYFGLRFRQPLSARYALVASGEMGSAWLYRAGLEMAFDSPGGAR